MGYHYNDDWRREPKNLKPKIASIPAIPIADFISTAGLYLKVPLPPFTTTPNHTNKVQTTTSSSPPQGGDMGDSTRPIAHATSKRRDVLKVHEIQVADIVFPSNRGSLTCCYAHYLTPLSTRPRKNALSPRHRHHFPDEARFEECVITRTYYLQIAERGVFTHTELGRFAVSTFGPQCCAYYLAWHHAQN